jgi:hypothetical protein
METVKIIKRISKEGKDYFQIAENGDNETAWLPVFISTKLENKKFEIISTERKVDKNGKVFEVLEINKKNIFKVPEKNIYIITK